MTSLSQGSWWALHGRMRTRVPRPRQRASTSDPCTGHAPLKCCMPMCRAPMPSRRHRLPAVERSMAVERRRSSSLAMVQCSRVVHSCPSRRRIRLRILRGRQSTLDPFTSRPKRVQTTYYNYVLLGSWASTPRGVASCHTTRERTYRNDYSRVRTRRCSNGQCHGHGGGVVRGHSLAWCPPVP